jgi:hypothetical protein
VDELDTELELAPEGEFDFDQIAEVAY